MESPYRYKNLSAFPHGETDYHQGMRYREWVAGLALAGLLSRENIAFEIAAQVAVLAADQLLKELAKPAERG